PYRCPAPGEPLSTRTLSSAVLQVGVPVAGAAAAAVMPTPTRPTPRAVAPASAAARRRRVRVGVVVSIGVPRPAGTRGRRAVARWPRLQPGRRLLQAGDAGILV